MQEIYRADLHIALRGVVPDDAIRMDTEPTAIDERGDGVAVTFDDGATEQYDCVVGADGVHSTVRERCIADAAVRERDTYVWSLWGPRDVDVGADMVSLWGPGSEGFVARVGDRVGVNLAARLEEPPEPPGRDALRRQADAIGWRLPAILDVAGDEEPFFDRIREVRCGSWHTDRVAVIGDAAHAVHPIAGMGASLALRDALVLGDLLADASGADSHDGVPEALDRYEERRRGPVRRVQRQARWEAAVTFLRSPVLRRLRNAVVSHTPLVELFVRQAASDG